MGFGLRTRLITISAGLLLCLCGVVGACDEAAMRDCASVYSSHCDIITFGFCLANAGYEQCGDNLGLDTSLAIGQAYLACGNSTSGTDFEGLEGLEECGEAIEQCSTDLSEAFDTQEPSPIDFICICEDPDGYSAKLIGDFMKCINSKGNCPSSVASAFTNITDIINPLVQGIMTGCDSLNVSDGTCECSRKIEQCVDSNLGEGVLQSQFYGEGGESGEVDRSYPGCLTVGDKTYTEKDFQRAGECILDLDSTCGVTRDDLTEENFDMETPNIGLLVLSLTLSCRKGCEDIMTGENAGKKIRNATDECFFKDNLPLPVLVMSNEDINDLSGQAETDFCSSVDEALFCLVKEIEDCPYLLVSTQIGIDGLQPGEDLPLDGPRGNISLGGNLFLKCKVNLLDFASEFSGGNSADSSHKLSLTVLLAATLAALLHLM